MYGKICSMRLQRYAVSQATHIHMDIAGRAHDRTAFVSGRYRLLFGSKRNMKMTNNDSCRSAIHAKRTISTPYMETACECAPNEERIRFAKNIIIVIEKSTGSRTFISPAIPGEVHNNSRIKCGEWEE